LEVARKNIREYDGESASRLDPIASPVPASVQGIRTEDHVAGNRSAKLVLIEYSDLECPYCRNYHPVIDKLVREKEYADRIAVVYRHFPLPIHAGAAKKAEGAECAAEVGGPGKFWEYISHLYASDKKIPLEELGGVATPLGLDAAAFQSCLISGRYAERVQQDTTTGLSAGVNATPTTFFLRQGDQPVKLAGTLSYDQLKKRVDDYLR
jgi:protein-disulfide isomerase